MLKNVEDGYGLISVSLHWITALAVVGLFLLGLWMVDLTYYDAWYRTAPNIHKGIGVLLFVTVAIRILWRQSHPRPRPDPAHSALERRAASVVHTTLYVLLLAIMTSGYLISTADGRPIDVFGLFQVPATLTGLPNQADLAGDVHFALAVAAVGLAAVHGAAALKHHFVDRDRTLLRMLGRRSPRP